MELRLTLAAYPPVNLLMPAGKLAADVPVVQLSDVQLPKLFGYADLFLFFFMDCVPKLK